MKALWIEPGQMPVVRDIELNLNANHLEGLDQLLGGGRIRGNPIMAPDLYEPAVVFYNLDGQSKGLAPNQEFGAGMVYGPMLVVGVDHSRFKLRYRSLTIPEIRAYAFQFSPAQAITSLMD